MNLLKSFLSLQFLEYRHYCKYQYTTTFHPEYNKSNLTAGSCNVLFMGKVKIAVYHSQMSDTNKSPY